jgi:ribosomal protein L11 methyltransferase
VPELAVVLTVPVPDAELAADALWSLGVLAVEERDSSLVGMVELWTSVGTDAEAIAVAAEGFPARWHWRMVEVDPEDAQRWREHAHPSWIHADFVVCPAWVEFDAPSDAVVVRIEPGTTFGLGDHPSTVLALRSLRPLAAGASVLDVGCGSGVLGVTAAVLGAHHVDAIDITAAAVAATTANAAANGVADRVRASTTALADVDAAYDLVVANILAPALVELAPDLRRVLADDGALVVSGVLRDRYQHVLDALAPLRVVDTRTLEGWAAVTLRR